MTAMHESGRQIVLDTETTGMNQDGKTHYEGHKIVEIGAVEIINRRLTGNHFHVYLKPNRLVDPEAFAVHGISDEFLADKPEFSAIAEDFIKFVDGAELIIHNASFDVGFLDYEFRLMSSLHRIADHCTVTDSLALARKKFPGKRNNLDALCERYHIDNSSRTLHGALLDAEILADVYLIMTGGQTALSFSDASLTENQAVKENVIQRLSARRMPLKIIRATESEITSHQQSLDLVDKKAGQSVWRKRFEG